MSDFLLKYPKLPNIYSPLLIKCTEMCYHLNVYCQTGASDGNAMTVDMLKKMSSDASGLNLRYKTVAVITFWSFSCLGNFLTIKTWSYISDWHVIQLERHCAAVDRRWPGRAGPDRAGLVNAGQYMVSQSVTWQLSQSVSNDVEGSGRCGATPHTSGLSVQPSRDESHS